MRKIKFRAWNKKEKIMVDLKEITPLALSFDPCLAGGGTGIYIPDHPDLEIMQFTGLLDKNGKEVYEGDIINWGDNYPSVIEWSQETCQFVCHEYYPKTSKNAQEDRWHDIPAYTNEPEVLGNLYENPELLQPKETEE